MRLGPSTSFQLPFNLFFSARCAEVHSIKASNNSNTGGMQSQLNDVKRYFGADIQRMLQEFQVQSNLQQAENVRLQQQVTSLKGEKTSVHQQLLGF